MLAPNHLLLSWLGAAALLHNRRERILVAYSGLASDLDGFGWLYDQFSNSTNLYLAFHHKAGHGIFAALVFAIGVGWLAHSQRVLAALCAFVAVHLHILCDLVGSQGADGFQWPIYYFYPFFPDVEITLDLQWNINAWQNRLILFLAMCTAVWYFYIRKVCFFEVFGVHFERAAIKLLATTKRRLRILLRF